MEDKYLVKAIKSLKPDSEFVLIDGDYSSIQWHELSGQAPTMAQITAEIKNIKASEEEAEATKAKAKAALLDRLSITAEEATLLLS